jgi:hypothetical protein
MAFAMGLIACGSSGTDPGAATPTNGMVAQIGGQNFTTANGFAMATATQATARIYYISIAGSDGVAGTDIFLGLSNISTPGTYPFGVDGMTVFGGDATVIDGTTYIAPNTGAAGTFTITTLTDDRIVGSFSFDAVGPGPLYATRLVRNGQFNLPLARAGPFPNYPDQYGSVFSGTIGGAQWNAASVVATKSSGLGMVVANSKYNIIFASNPMPTAAGDIPVGSAAGQMTVIISDIGDSAPDRAVWTTTVAGSTGNFAITSLTATRMIGSMNVTLPPSPGTKAAGSLAISITFNVGLEQM